MSFLELGISFSSNFASLFSVMRRNSSVLFLSKSLYALDKRSLSECKFSYFQLLAWKLTKCLMSFFKSRVSFPLNLPLKSLKNLHFDWPILYKVYKVWPEKLQRVIIHNTEESCKLKEKLTCCLENDLKNLVNFHQNTWKCQNWDFDGILLSKVENA